MFASTEDANALGMTIDRETHTIRLVRSSKRRPPSSSKRGPGLSTSLAGGTRMDGGSPPARSTSAQAVPSRSCLLATRSCRSPARIAGSGGQTC